MYKHYPTLYAACSDMLPLEHTRTFAEPSILATGIDSAIVHEDGAYLVMRDITIKYHRDGIKPSLIAGVVRGTFLDPNRALNYLNREAIQ